MKEHSPEWTAEEIGDNVIKELGIRKWRDKKFLEADKAVLKSEIEQYLINLFACIREQINNKSLSLNKINEIQSQFLKKLEELNKEE